MLELTNTQWVKHAIMHPFEGFEDMHWKKAGSVKYAVMIVGFWFIASVFYHRLYGFQFRAEANKIFNIIPYLFQTVILFLTWVAGNWAVCTLLDGEGILKNIFIYSAYALVPYVISIYLEVALSHILIRDEQVFIDMIHSIGLLWSGILLFSAIKAVHQYSFRKTIGAIILTIGAILIILLLLILLLALFQQIYVFVYSIYTEIIYRLKV